MNCSPKCKGAFMNDVGSTEPGMAGGWGGHSKVDFSSNKLVDQWGVEKNR